VRAELVRTRIRELRPHPCQEGQSQPGTFVPATIQRHSVSVPSMGLANRPLLHTVDPPVIAIFQRFARMQ
jgi:hypothetical protein